jgi:hypothetical protein
MAADPILYAGIELSTGRKPVTFAALDDELNVGLIQTWDVSEALLCLSDYENIWLAINVPQRRPETSYDLKEKILQVGFALYPSENDSKQLLLTNPQDCFQALVGKKPLARRTLEGRLQRTALLYEQGLQITDPVDIFEEITRYKLRHGILPLDNIYSSKELDVLVAAYLAWLAVNRPGQMVAKAPFVLPAQE